MCFYNQIMYLRYFKKCLKLRLLKFCYGLDFEGRIIEPNPKFNGYEGCYPVKRMLKKINVSETDSILDIGCGKGLFLYYAKRFNFEKIDGLEYSTLLYDIAKKNVNRMADNRIRLFNCDARDFKYYSNYNIFFFCNPFSVEIMEKVINKIIESYKENKRKITVYYQFPFLKDLFIQKGFGVKYCSLLHGIFVLK